MSRQTDKPKVDDQRRRLRGTALGELRTAMKRLENTTAKLNCVRDEILDAHDLYRDQVDWNTGVIYDADPTVITDRVAIGRITTAEYKRQRAEVAEVSRLDLAVREIRRRFADLLGCLPTDVNPQTGEITGTPVVSVDPYESRTDDTDTGQCDTSCELARAAEAE